jgi:predicted transcriptional regulator/transcriptional regulator with XRE-family HTH domain
MRERTALGGTVRGLRRRAGLTQAELASRLGVSASYVNLIEHGRRALSADLLIRLAGILHLDLKALAGESETRIAADLLEIFGDPLFEGHALAAGEVQELAATAPSVARAVVSLYRAYRGARESAETLAMRLDERDDVRTVDPSQLPSEEVNDFVQRHLNHFPGLESASESLAAEARLPEEDLYQALVRYLKDAHGVEVRVERLAAMRGAVRRYGPETRVLQLSEVLRRGSRNFQVAYQVGLLREAALLDRLTSDPFLTTPESRSLARIALASYFAASVLMPYRAFYDAARAERYDIELLGHRFRTSFEQVCHRLTTLRRPGAEGVPFHFVRVDIAGNISKRFSASGLRFPRFSGACPRWNVFTAFTTPGMIRTQLSQMPDGATYFWMARTLRKNANSFHSPLSVFAIGMGCEISYARELVYADGVSLSDKGAVVPVGITCRLCERLDCEQRAFPALQHRLTVRENVRGASFFAPAEA